MRRIHSVKIIAICAVATALAGYQANAALVGGTYTNGGTATTTWPATATCANCTNSPIRYQSGANPTSGLTNQGFTGEDPLNPGSGAVLSEIVTPTTSFKLDTISIIAGGAAPTPTGMSLHLYTIGSHTSVFSDFVTAGSAFYFADTDLLGGGNGFSFGVNGIPAVTGRGTIINFTLDNNGTSDLVTLNAGTSYAVELWNRTSPYVQNTFTWVRNSVADPNGQAFAKNSSVDFSTSRNTLAANGVAGGAPRTFQLALYGTVPVVALTGDYNHNGVIDAADYTVWRDTLGQSVTAGTGADGNSNGTIDDGDFTVWTTAFGASGAGAGAVGAAVPEPASILLAAIAAIFGIAIGRRRASERCLDASRIDRGVNHFQ